MSELLPLIFRPIIVPINRKTAPVGAVSLGAWAWSI